MTNLAADTDLAPRSSTGTAVPLPAPPETGHSPWRRLHSVLRGRYHWAALLGLVLGAGLAGLGYRSVTLRYQALGVVQIKPVVPAVLYKSEESGVMPMFDAFVATEIARIGGARVMQMALEEEAWRKTGLGMSPEVQQDFQANLRVTRAPGAQLILVTYQDENGGVAEAAVRAVLTAYGRVATTEGETSDGKRRGVLDKHKQTLEREYGAKRQTIQALAQEYGTDSLDALHESRLKEAQELAKVLRDAEQALVAAGLDPERPPAALATQPADEPRPAAALSVASIAAVDHQMASYVQSRAMLEQEIAALGRLGKNHPRMAEVKARLEYIENMIHDYAEQYRQAPPRPAPALVRPAPGNVDPALLYAQYDRARQAAGQARQEFVALGQKNLSIKSLKAEAETLQQRLDETKFRLQQLELESSLGGRIEVDVDSVYLSPTPVNAGKKRQMAVLGGLGGMALGVGVLVLISVLDPRLRHASDRSFGRRNLRLLGMLPHLPADLSDPEQAAMAGHSVHHIRTLLQLGTQGTAPPVIVVSGPSSGCGKTSLTMALGLSYAGAQSRTLMIDCDLVGGGLTRKLELSANRRLGQILVAEGVATAVQVDEALQQAATTGQRLGEALVASGAVAPDAVARAIAAQRQDRVGLLQALNGSELGKCVRETGVPGLWALPLGEAGATDVTRLSPAAVSRLIEKARAEFDTVLVDTGPVPGSLEAAMVAAQADEVVLVVSRGDQRPQLVGALAFLEEIGARISGLVFNRADEADVNRSSAASMMSVSRRHGGDAASERRDRLPVLVPVRHRERFGPLGGAMSSGGAVEPSDSMGEPERGTRH